jgi:hypothetical protein
MRLGKSSHMAQRYSRNERKPFPLRYASALFVFSGLLGLVPASIAQTTVGPITIGAGLRTSFGHTETDGSDSTDKFFLDSARLYISGPVVDKVKFMFNTEYDGATNKIGVLDAVARFEVSPMFNVWAGRFLPPSDRSNLYGPYYSNQWGVYTDGIQDGYPFVFQGRDNGVVYWGDFAKKIKVSLGAFDGQSATGNHKILGAARVQIDFWDKEEGYYLNGTYYGDKNLLAIGGATQIQDGHTASTIDFLLEKKLPGGGAFTIESEYSNYNRLGGYDSRYAKSQGAYILGSYLFPKKVGIGKFQLLGKYAKAEFTHGTDPNYHQKTAEVNFNYVIKQFNARVMSFYRDTRFNRERPNTWTAGLGLQVQM